MKKESKLSAALTAVIDIVTAGLLWLLCSPGIVTVGAASAALYYCVVKCIRHERGRLVKSFFAAFRRDFRIATLLWLIFLAAALILAADVYAFERMGGGAAGTVGKILLLALLGFYPWVFAFVSRFSNTVSGTLKYCGYLALRNVGKTALMTLELVGFAAAVYLMPPLVFILPGLVCLLLSLHIEPVFKPLTAEMSAADGDDWFNE